MITILLTYCWCRWLILTPQIQQVNILHVYLFSLGQGNVVKNKICYLPSCVANKSLHFGCSNEICNLYCSWLNQLSQILTFCLLSKFIICSLMRWFHLWQRGQEPGKLTYWVIARKSLATSHCRRVVLTACWLSTSWFVCELSNNHQVGVTPNTKHQKHYFY